MNKKKKTLVVKSNHIVRATYQMTVGEKRLLLLAFVVAREQGLTNESWPFGLAPPMLKIEATRFAECFRLDSSLAYRQLEAAANKLQTGRFRFTTDGEYHDDVKSYVNWTGRCDYFKKEGYVKIEFTHYVMHYLCNLNAFYTQHYLEAVIGFTSFYAYRMYEYLLSWRKARKTDFVDIDKFRLLMGIPEGQYQSSGNLKQKVLDVAISQINEFSDVTVSVDTSREGRKVLGYQFKWRFDNEENSGETVVCYEMTEPQVSLFAHRLAELHVFSNKYCKRGASPAAFKEWVENELKSSDRINEWMPFLELCGFEKRYLLRKKSKKTEQIEASTESKGKEVTEPSKVEQNQGSIGLADVWTESFIASLSQGLSNDPLFRWEYFKGLPYDSLEPIKVELEKAERRKEWKSYILRSTTIDFHATRLKDEWGFVGETEDDWKEYSRKVLFGE